MVGEADHDCNMYSRDSITSALSVSMKTNGLISSFTESILPCTEIFQKSGCECAVYVPMLG